MSSTDLPQWLRQISTSQLYGTPEGVLHPFEGSTSTSKRCSSV
jgi:hypothetical protein